MENNCTLSSCQKCNSKLATAQCVGCNKKLCGVCLPHHRYEMTNTIGELVNVRNELFENIQYSRKNNANFLNERLTEIQRWKNEMHACVDRVACSVEDRAKSIWSEADRNLHFELQQVSEKLGHWQKHDDFVEADIEKVSQQLKLLKDKIDHFHEQISINVSSLNDFNWNSLISVTFNGVKQLNMSEVPSPTDYETKRIGKQDQYNFESSVLPPPYSSIVTLPPSVPRPKKSSHQPFPRKYSATYGGTSAATTYICIGCKTLNNFHRNQPNYCSGCQYPYTYNG